VETLKLQLHSEQESRELEQEIADLERRLEKTSADIVAKQNESKSLDAELDKLLHQRAENDDSAAVTRKRYVAVLLSVQSSCLAILKSLLTDFTDFLFFIDQPILP